MGVGVEAVISHRDLALVGNMGGHPGNELQIIQPLHLLGVFPVPVADLAFLFKREAFQRKHRPDPVLAHPLGLCLGLGPDPAVNIEPYVPPGISSHHLNDPRRATSRFFSLSLDK